MSHFCATRRPILYRCAPTAFTMASATASRGSSYVIGAAVASVDVHDMQAGAAAAVREHTHVVGGRDLGFTMGFEKIVAGTELSD